MNKPSCLIVGAGMAGLTAARFLVAGGWSVVLLDKGRAIGGRMATRRIGACTLDHGAQFFTVRDERFGRAVQEWEEAGWASPWFISPSFTNQSGHICYRATGGMNVLAAHLASQLDVRRETAVQMVEPADGGWRITTSTAEVFEAQAILLTPPAPQTNTLLACLGDSLPPDIRSTLSSIRYEPCFALLVTLDGPSLIQPPGFFRPESGIIALIADNARKGISIEHTALTIHATAEFSRQYLDAPVDTVTGILLRTAQPWFGAAVTTSQLHRWKYSRPVAAERPLYLFSPQPAPLAIAGDGFGGPRVEGAFLSGLAAAQRLAQAVG